MPLNTLGLVAGIAVARREGVAPDQIARVALPGAIFSNLALGVIMVDRLAKQEAAAESHDPLVDIRLTLEDARLMCHAIDEGCRSDHQEARAMLATYLKELLAELEPEPAAYPAVSLEPASEGGPRKPPHE